MKILVIDDEPELRDILKVLLESTYPFTVLEAESGNEGIEVIKNHPDLACIICDYNMPNGNGDVVYRFLLEHHKNIPYILCSSSPANRFEIFKAHPPFGSVIKPQIFPALFDCLLPLIKKPNPPEYVRIRTATILRLGLLSYDLYVKLSDDKYLKIMREGDLFDNADFFKFDSKRIEYLYVQTQHAFRVLEQMIQGISRLPHSKMIATPEQNIGISTVALEIIAEFNAILGLTPEVQKLIEGSISFTIQTIRQNPKLSSLYQELLVDQNTYLASHSVMLAHLSCGIASLLKWPSDTTFYKLSTASFLHDITLRTDDLAKLNSLEELDAQQNNFTAEQKKLFLLHPVQAADLANSVRELPADVNTIILQHHERPEGDGFPHKLSHTHISPLAAVFIISEKIIDFRQNSKSDETLIDFINSLPRSFQVGHFRNIIQAITQSIVDQNFGK